MTEVKAILIDPEQRTISEVLVPVFPPEPGDEEVCVNQIDRAQVAKLLGCGHVWPFPMPTPTNCLAVLVARSMGVIPVDASFST